LGLAFGGPFDGDLTGQGFGRDTVRKEVCHLPTPARDQGFTIECVMQLEVGGSVWMFGAIDPNLLPPIVNVPDNFRTVGEVERALELLLRAAIRRRSDLNHQFGTTDHCRAQQRTHRDGRGQALIGNEGDVWFYDTAVGQQALCLIAQYLTKASFACSQVEGALQIAHHASFE
jgi:hypothetical protein